MSVHHLPAPSQRPQRINEFEANQALHSSAGVVAARRRQYRLYRPWPLAVQVVAGFLLGVGFGAVFSALVYGASVALRSLL